MEDSSGVAVLMPDRMAAVTSSPSSSSVTARLQGNEREQPRQQLIQVIEKLSKIVEKRPRRCTVAGRKRSPLARCGDGGAGAVSPPRNHRNSPIANPSNQRREASPPPEALSPTPCKRGRTERDKEGDAGSGAGAGAEAEERKSEGGQGADGLAAEFVPNDVSSPLSSSAAEVGRTVTCYQCSLCRFLSPTLSALREHLHQHNEQHSELLLMCSECRFTSRCQEQLEAHVRQHLEQTTEATRSAAAAPSNTHPAGRLAGATATTTTTITSLSTAHTDPSRRGGTAAAADDPRSYQGRGGAGAGAGAGGGQRKWYSYECGTYRCLICSYTCVQQRMLKTHAWKHASLVDCSYPIFEDEAEQPQPQQQQQTGRQDAAAMAAVPAVAIPAPGYTAATFPRLRQEGGEEAIVLLAAVGGEKPSSSGPQALRSASGLQIELCTGPVGVGVGSLCREAEREGEKVAGMVPASRSLQEQEQEQEEEQEQETAFASKSPVAEEPLPEVQVATDAEPLEVEVELEEDEASSGGSSSLGSSGSGGANDSLLSSAQKIISSRGNSAGHVNVIVERLPCAEAPVTSKPLLLSPEVAGDKDHLLAVEEVELNTFYQPPEEVVIDWSGAASKQQQQNQQQQQQQQTQAVEEDEEEEVTDSCSATRPADENVPPARRRTHSESLRLHSLAAEVLVAMPTRAPQVKVAAAASTAMMTTTAAAAVAPRSHWPDTGRQQQQRAAETPVTVTTYHHPKATSASSSSTAAAEFVLKVQQQGAPGSTLDPPGREDVLAAGVGAEGVEGPVGAKGAGISLSLLTVIERLRERSDTDNATDEDILKELRNNAQSHPGDSAVPAAAAAAGVVGIGAGGGAPGSAVVVAAAGAGAGAGDSALLADAGLVELVEYVAGSDRPYRCRLCRYSSDTKGYIKQHLRVHRHKQPYQCPICEHVAADSKELERHTLHHCKARTYPCKLCSKAFYYKSQLKSHEREHQEAAGGGVDATVTLTPLLTDTNAVTTATGAEDPDRTMEEDALSAQRVYKCDVCDYTSATYVGVRNHRRIHNSDKPYRCCSCDFATTNMNSLKSHMKRHPLEHQAVQLLEQYRCSLCGYVCSHPPSLKSHMWKHAGDKNYNYEQVNKAINEAISQSGRSPTVGQKAPAPGVEPKAEAPVVLLGRQENLTSLPAGLGRSLGPRDGSGGGVAEGGGGGGGGGGGAGAASAKERAGLEYCMLLFCCCICGFESTSKEQLLEHMKEHEGDIISIILNKEQQQQQQQEQQQQPQLQSQAWPAEGSVEP
ncbi:zinc finger protein 507 [Engraulis encrasicolus]|uniref:zinc finger protein 507 n=1 Tax=Engraulis encrasicolus TaxID=184585 RepID=UPI002FD051EE